MPGSKRKTTAKELLERVTSNSGGLAGLVTSPFGALGDLVRKNASTVLDPDTCDDMVGRLLKTGRASLGGEQATKLLSVADLAAVAVHPYFIRAAARQGVAFYIDADGNFNRQTYSAPRDLVPVDPEGEIDVNFFVEPEWFPHFSKFVERGAPVLLVGPPGAGKSEAVQRLFSKRDQPLEILSCTHDTTADDFEGAIEVSEGSTIWTPSVCTIAVMEGHGLLLDEIDAAPSESCYALYRVLDGKDMRIARRGYKGTIPLNANFRVVGTQNTEGRGDDRGIHHGRSFQDEAFLDRWGNFIRTDYLPPDVETTILCKRTGLPEKQASMIVKAATELRRAFNNDQIMLCTTMRRTLAVAGNVAAGMTPEDAWKYAVQNRATRGKELQDIEDFVNRVYGSTAKRRQ